MFEDTFIVLILVAVAAVVILGIMVGRKALAVVGARSDIESAKLQIEIDKLRYQRTVNKHSQNEALAELANRALPPGETTAAPAAEKPPVAEDLPLADEELPEMVKNPKGKDIKQPYQRLGLEQYKEMRDASDAQFEVID